MPSSAAPTVPADAAAWIRAVVLGGDRNASGWSVAPVSLCACQYGPCGYCKHGDHAHCSHRDGAPAGGPETYITNRYAIVWSPPPGAHPRATTVWLADHVCRWSCPCSCRTTPPAARPVQDTLFVL